MTVLRSLSLSLLAATAIRVAFFEPGKAGWKKTEDGKGIAVDDNGNPIWIDANGGEVSHSAETITRLNGEAATLRRRAEKAETDLKVFEGLDASKAREALDTVGKIKQGELIAAGKVDEVKAEITKSYDKRLTDAEAAVKAATDRANNVLMQTAFVGSKFIAEKTVLPPDIMMATFGNRFKIDGDKPVGLKADGSGPIYSLKRAGEIADFDEAMEIVLGEYSNRNAVLKGANNAGSGNGGGGGNGPGGKKSMNMSDFKKLGPAEQSTYASEVRQGKAELVD